MAAIPPDKAPRRTALVTGAAGGLGREIVAGLLAEDFVVYAVTRDGALWSGSQESFPEAFARKALIVAKADLSDPEDLCNLGHLIQQIGGVDVVVNNAGIYLDDPRKIEYQTPFSLDIGDFERTIQVNSIAAAKICWEAIPYMTRKNYGRVVNVSSGMGRIEDISAISPFYSLSKLLLNGLTIALADAVKSFDITVNSVCPGWIPSKMGGLDAPGDAATAAREVVRLSTLPAGGPSGAFFRNGEELDWTFSPRGKLRKSQRWTKNE